MSDRLLGYPQILRLTCPTLHELTISPMSSVGITLVCGFLFPKLKPGSNVSNRSSSATTFGTRLDS